MTQENDMTEQRDLSSVDPTVSHLLCLSQGCSRETPCGSSDWPCVHSQAEPSLDTLQSVPNRSSEKHFLVPATVGTEGASQDSLVTMVNDEVEVLAGQCGHSLDRCQEKGWKANPTEIKYREAAQWCYMAAKQTEFHWRALGIDAGKLFAQMPVKHLGLRPDDRRLMKAFWVKWRATVFHGYHRYCETARCAVGENHPRTTDNNQGKLNEAYVRMAHLHDRFTQGCIMPYHDLEAGSYDRADITAMTPLHSMSNAIASIHPTEQPQGNLPGECSGSLVVCQQNTQTGHPIAPEYSKAAQYFYKLANEEKKKLDWDLFSCDFAKQFNEKRDVWTFMAAFRYQVKLVHNDCTTIKWAQRRKGAKAVRRSKANTDLAAAYSGIEHLLPDADGT